MEAIGIPEETIRILKKYDFHFRKKWGQNFLIDASVLEKILGTADLKKTDCVLEIGPGIGTMTQRLSWDCGKVVAVEIDEVLINVLKETLACCENVKIINGDILKIDLMQLVQEENEGKPIKVVANLPYYITTPIVTDLLENRIPFESITVMVQEEVARRMCKGPGSKDYGALSLVVQYYCVPHLVGEVPPNCFIPRPSVGSSIVCLRPHDHPPVTVNDEKFMFRLIRAAFNQRRKTLANALSNAPGLQLTRQQVTDAVREMGLPADVRGEVLDLTQFSRLSDLLYTKKF